MEFIQTNSYSMDLDIIYEVVKSDKQNDKSKGKKFNIRYKV